MTKKILQEKLEAYRNGSNGNNVQRVNKEIAGGKHFPAANDDNFTASNAADEYVEKMGYSKGSMQQDAPIALSKGEGNYISKWWNLGDDVLKIDGLILPDPEFRDGGATVIFFKEAK